MGNGGIGTCFSRKKESNESYILRNIDGELVLESVVLQGILTEDSSVGDRTSVKKSGVRAAAGKENRGDLGFARSTWSVLKSDGSSDDFLSPEESEAFACLALSNYQRVSRRQVNALEVEIDTEFAALACAYHFDLTESSIERLFASFAKTADFLARAARDALSQPENAATLKISTKIRASANPKSVGPRERGRLSRFFHESEELKALRGRCLAQQTNSSLSAFVEGKNFEAENEVSLYQFFDAVEVLGLAKTQSIVYRRLTRSFEHRPSRGLPHLAHSLPASSLQLPENLVRLPEKKKKEKLFRLPLIC